VEAVQRLGAMIPLPAAASLMSVDCRTLRKYARRGRISEVYLFGIQMVCAADMTPELLDEIDAATICACKKRASRFVVKDVE